MQNESLEHLFRDCQISQRIWSCSLGIVATNGKHLSIQEWIKNFLNLFKKKKMEEGKGMEIDFISTLWGLWIHRNEVIFRGSSTNPMRIMAIIRDHSGRARREKKGTKRTIGSRDLSMEDAGARNLDWTIGDTNTTNIQTIVVDGAWKKNVGSNKWQAAIAWKNLNNDPQEESAEKKFANSPEQAEAYAILKAITDMAWKTAGIIIKSDSKEVILALKSKKGTNKNIDSIIRDIRRLAHGFMFVSCIKVSRAEVQLAHNLATQARKS